MAPVLIGEAMIQAEVVWIEVKRGSFSEVVRIADGLRECIKAIQHEATTEAFRQPQIHTVIEALIPGILQQQAPKTAEIDAERAGDTRGHAIGALRIGLRLGAGVTWENREKRRQVEILGAQQ